MENFIIVYLYGCVHALYFGNIIMKEIQSHYKPVFDSIEKETHRNIRFMAIFIMTIGSCLTVLFVAFYTVALVIRRTRADIRKILENSSET